MLDQKLIESRMIEQVGTTMKTVKKKWNKYSQVRINY